jgi:hypothetical protein
MGADRMLESSFMARTIADSRQRVRSKREHRQSSPVDGFRPTS